ncbi:hypothetical protein ASG22_04745 [Chryseobacterium sp. Leaf405]|uniref:hypothetical protein n=1 Tax=Chryseobacterium sp. Leaf405 TaxID=1736367 RepID=UPI0006FC37E7|nr:hypothetical protein [Chryseobacterium sp. Leaf405]KQT26004.1 hypothetical protein ASG22_04745 [Chryseobacterium sp. Leaf405]
MPDNIFLYFFIGFVLFAIGKSIYYFIEKKTILENYKQVNSIEFKNIYGTIVTKSGMLRQRFEWCKFDILVNQNSVFLFTKNFYFIPSRLINLVYSTSNNKYLKQTRKPKQVREFNVNKNNIEIVFMRDRLMFETSKLYLKNLTNEQIILLESVLNKKTND